jgi:hypothetical protein
MRGGARALFVSALAFTAACDDSTDPNANNITYTATLTGAAEKPNAVTTSGTGTWTGSYNPSTGILSYTLSFSGLGTNATLAHIHGPATVDQFAGVIVNLDQAAQARTITLGATSGTGTGTVNLNAGATWPSAGATITGVQLKDLMDQGMTYVNIHTTANGGGEIRGQITKQ